MEASLAHKSTPKQLGLVQMPRSGTLHIPINERHLRNILSVTPAPPSLALPQSGASCNPENGMHHPNWQSLECKEAPNPNSNPETEHVWNSGLKLPRNPKVSGSLDCHSMPISGTEREGEGQKENKGNARFRIAHREPRTAGA